MPRTPPASPPSYQFLRPTIFPQEYFELLDQEVAADNLLEDIIAKIRDRARSLGEITFRGAVVSEAAVNDLREQVRTLQNAIQTAGQACILEDLHDLIEQSHGQHYLEDALDDAVNIIQKTKVIRQKMARQHRHFTRGIEAVSTAFMCILEETPGLEANDLSRGILSSMEEVKHMLDNMGELINKEHMNKILDPYSELIASDSLLDTPPDDVAYPYVCALNRVAMQEASSAQQARTHESTATPTTPATTLTVNISKDHPAYPYVASMANAMARDLQATTRRATTFPRPSTSGVYMPTEPSSGNASTSSRPQTRPSWQPPLQPLLLKRGAHHPHRSRR